MADHHHHFGSNTIDFSDDDDDYSDELSPTDGYFSGSSHVPQNVLIFDEPEDNSRSKEREAAEESSSHTYHPISSPTQASSPVTRNTVYTPSTSSQDNSPTEPEQQNRFAHIQNDPPPLYEAATAGRQPPQSQSSETAPLSPNRAVSYNTMNTVGFPVPFRDNPAQPQSMADRPDDGDMYEDEEAAVPRKRYRGWFDRTTTGGRFRRFVLTMLAVLAGILLILALIGKMQENSREAGNQDEDVKPILPEHPAVPMEPSKALPTRSAVPTTATYIDTPSTTSGFPISSNTATPSAAPLDPKIPDPDVPEPIEPKPTKPFHPGSKIRIIQTSTSVSGKFTLRDLLYIRTTSGSVTATIVIPHDWNDDNETPSILDIGTRSGSINVRFVDEYDHPLESSDCQLREILAQSSVTKIRPFKQFINSSGSGAISGSYIHGNSTVLGTGSGSISGTWYPIHPASDPSTFKTIVHGSGSTTLTIEEPLSHSYPASPSSSLGHPLFSNFHSLHEAHGSGSITLTYPPSWTGSLQIDSSGSGSITAAGKGLEITEWIGQHVKGSRGNGEGTVKIESSGSGSVTFRALGSGRGGWGDWFWRDPDKELEREEREEDEREKEYDEYERERDREWEMEERERERGEQERERDEQERERHEQERQRDEQERERDDQERERKERERESSSSSGSSWWKKWLGKLIPGSASDDTSS